VLNICVGSGYKTHVHGALSAL